MQQVSFDLEQILQDRAYSEAYGILGLNCFEYTIWQMIRQLGIRDYKLALYTKAFITEPKPLHKIFSIRTIAANLLQIEENLLRFYGLGRITYAGCHDSKRMSDFIKDTIHQGRFLFTLYNNYFNTINNITLHPRRHEYHSTLITGYDDRRREYIPLIDGIYNIGYDDFKRMQEDAKATGKWIYDWGLFYIGRIAARPSGDEFMDQREFIKDLEQTVFDWEKESRIFKDGAESLRDRFPTNAKELDGSLSAELQKIAVILHNVKLGYHGNLFLKLQALQKWRQVDIVGFQKEFHENTARFNTMANVLTKLSIDYNHQKLLDVLQMMDKIFVEDAYVWQCRLKNMLYEAGKG